ncbi:MAG: family 16 glycoside hydrolase, partial [Planctomycetota bacterium]
MILINIAIGAALALAATTPSKHSSPGAVTPAAVSSPSAGGWVSLFDGKTLNGWTEKGGRYDGDADWSVEDGAIVGREAEGARGGLLYT